MRLEKVAFAVVLGICATAHAQEDVYIDLSVLDNLNGVVGAPAEPLFPIIKPKPKKAVVKKPAQKAKAAKPAVAPTKEQPRVEAKQEPQPIPYVESTEGIVVVNTEPAMENSEIKQTEAEPQQQEQLVPAVDKPAPAIEQPVPVEKTTEQLSNAAPAATTESVEPVQKQPTPQSELLVEETPAAAQPTETKILFSDDDDEITPEKMAKIDEIVGRFQNTDKNKIAIYAYNLDNGVDTFKRKRVSLNRAVNVRGYLIKQGYKNFSIKIVNVEADSDKINTVELEEI